MKSFIHKLLLTALLALALTIFALCFASVHWLAELASHFMLHYAVLGVVVLCGLVLLRDKLWRIFIAAFICLIFSLHVACVLMPRHITRNVAYEDITILQFNINYANPNAQAIAEWINNYATITKSIDKITQHTKPDIVVLQEVSPEIASKLDLLTQNYPYQFIAPKAGAFGVAIFSQIPIREKQRIHFIDSWNAYTQLRFHTLTHGLAFSLLELHTMPPMGAQNASQRNAELKEITVAANQLATPSKILLGDLNITPYSPFFWRLERSTRLTNSMQGKSIEGTWPSFLPAMLRIPIDHMLLSDNIEMLERRIETSHDSDHMPVLTKLRIYATE